MDFGFWPAAILMIVIASWIFYRYAAPKGWRDWSRAGLVQAFIVALYAEMYGFPVTLYLLARFFNVDTASASGNLWSSLFGQGGTAMVIAMMVGLVFVAAGLYLLAQGWRTVYRASREKRLATEGVYSVVRHVSGLPRACPDVLPAVQRLVPPLSRHALQGSSFACRGRPVLI